MRRSEYLLLGALAAMWGLSYVFYRVGAPALGPALFVELRVALASGILALWAAGQGTLAAALGSFRSRARAFVTVGLLNSALPFTLIAVGELYLPASYSSVLNATAPLFSTLLAAGFLAQKIAPVAVAGLSVGLLGVVLLVGIAPFPLTPVVLAAIVLTLLAALSYGAAALLIRRYFHGTDPTQIAFGQLLAASLLLLPLSLWEVPSARFTGPAIESVIGIVVFSTVAAYTIYFRILLRVGPTEALSVTYLMPIFGVLWGYLLLREELGYGILLGVATILAGVALVTLPSARRAAARTG
ncbi:MAG TPA: DMT family transporter [Thermoplasmata archaeon]|nr:DMT family transporter [Thermoplasmata archaeon]